METYIRSAIEVRMFGGLRVLVNGKAAKFRTRKTASIFAYLVYLRGSTVGRDALGRLFWPDSGPEASRQSVRMALSDIRAVVGASALLTDSATVCFLPDRVWSDVGQLHSVAHSSTAEFELLREAAGLVVGRFLEGESGEWIDTAWSGIEDEYSSVVCRLVGQCRSSDHVVDVVGQANRALELLGCREEIHISLMEMYSDLGMPSQVLRQFEALESQLDEQWGEMPSAHALAILNRSPQTEGLLELGARKLDDFGPEIVGRRKVLGELVRSLEPSSPMTVVTLFGPGGVGKTTLARGVQAYFLKNSAMEQFFVDLSSETTEAGAVMAIQIAMGIPPVVGTEGYSSIRRRLRDSATLLVLDNCEQIEGTFGSAVSSMMTSVKESKVLITTRKRFDQTVGLEYEVGPMQMPEADVLVGDLTQYEAVALFVREARRVLPKFELGDDKAEDVVSVCRLLDGLPLAILLAANRVRTNTTREILVGIRESYERLRSFDEEVPVRHQSLIATVDWGFQLLSKSAQELVMCLSLYRCELSREDLATVWDVVDLDAALVELDRSSMITVNQAGDVATFSMLETVRQFLKRALAESSIFDMARAKHFENVETWTNQIYGNRMIKRVPKANLVMGRFEDCFSAVEFGLSSDVYLDRAALMYDALYQMVHSVAPDERFRFFGDLISKLPEECFSFGARARALDSWIGSTGNLYRLDEAKELLSGLLEKVEDDRELEARLESRLGHLEKSVGDYEAAEMHVQKALRLAQEQKDRVMVSSCMYSLALIAYCNHNTELSKSRHIEALSHMRFADNPIGLVRCLFDTGSALAELGDIEAALPLFNEALDLCRKLNSIKLEGLTRWQIGYALTHANRRLEALPHLVESCDLVVEAGFAAGLKWIFLKLSECLIACGHPELGLKFLGKGVSQREEEKRVLAVYEQDVLNPQVEVLREMLGDAVYERYWAEGVAMTWDELLVELHARPADEVNDDPFMKQKSRFASEV